MTIFGFSLLSIYLAPVVVVGGIFVAGVLLSLLVDCEYYFRDSTRKQLQRDCRMFLAAVLGILAWPVVAPFAVGWALTKFVSFLFEDIKD